MSKYKELLETQKSEILSALDYLEYSWKKIQSLSNEPAQLDPETLETWESFVARFARVSDIFLSKYLRTRIMMADPAFRGELRDFVNQAEKAAVITDADRWMQIRELRNKIAHEYTKNDLSKLFKDVVLLTPFLIADVRKAMS
ncbi:hypothetical protein GW916_01670 [bacterium]|nr:hypothetical protein [bacterium]